MAWGDGMIALIIIAWLLFILILLHLVIYLEISLSKYKEIGLWAFLIPAVMLVRAVKCFSLEKSAERIYKVLKRRGKI